MDSNQMTCPMCGAHFNSQDEMDSHAKQMHSQGGQEEHSMTCSKCGFKGSSSSELEKHSSEMMNDSKHSMAGQM